MMRDILMSDTVRIPPPDTVRGRIKHWLAEQAHRLRGPVLDVGGVLTPWYRSHRDIRSDLEWWTLNSDRSTNPTIRADAVNTELPDDSVGSIVCSEMLEHAAEPLAVLREAKRVCRVGGVILVTTVCAFPYHGFPSDYWRFTWEGLARLLCDAGFQKVCTSTEGTVTVTLDDHGAGKTEVNIPIHVFGSGVVT